MEAYLARIGLTQAPRADAAGLAGLVQAHRQSIGFENMDVMLGRGIRVDVDSVWAKLVSGPARRGGYCFEQNALFGAMLKRIGFDARPLLGRVWLGMAWPGEAEAMPPMTHTFSLVTIDGASWIADAGFGGSHVPPMPLINGAEVSTADGARHRLRRSGAPGEAKGAWLLERAGVASATDGRAAQHGDFQPQYSFGLGEVAPVDLELANHWTATRPATRFTSGCLASIVLEDGFASLSGRSLRMYAGGRGSTMELASARDWRSALADLFHVELTGQEVEQLALF